MTMTYQQRRRFLKSVPWISYHSAKASCRSLRSKTPLKALYTMYGKPPIGTDAYRCKTPAHWRFTALKRSYAQDGEYCMHHLITRCLWQMEEEQRLGRWMERRRESAGT